MAVSREKQTKASDSLEELVPVLREIILKLRMGVSDGLAYALTYQLRREIGYIVRNLGEGLPSTEHGRQAEEIIEAEKWQPERVRGESSS